MKRFMLIIFLLIVLAPSTILSEELDIGVEIQPNYTSIGYYVNKELAYYNNLTVNSTDAIFENSSSMTLKDHDTDIQIGTGLVITIPQINYVRNISFGTTTSTTTTTTPATTTISNITTTTTKLVNIGSSEPDRFYISPTKVTECIGYFCEDEQEYSEVHKLNKYIKICNVEFEKLKPRWDLNCIINEYCIEDYCFIEDKFNAFYNGIGKGKCVYVNLKCEIPNNITPEIYSLEIDFYQEGLRNEAKTFRIELSMNVQPKFSITNDEIEQDQIIGKFMFADTGTIIEDTKFILNKLIWCWCPQCVDDGIFYTNVINYPRELFGVEFVGLKLWHILLLLLIIILILVIIIILMRFIS